MKKAISLFTILAAALVLANCSSSKKASAAKRPPVTYGDLSTVIAANCSPCHITAQGGKKKPYDNLANVKADIDDIIKRIEMNPGDKGFMPFRKQQKLSDSVITVFRNWKADGMLEK